MLIRLQHNWCNLDAGSVVELDDGMARDLFSRGVAVPFVKPEIKQQEAAMDKMVRSKKISRKDK